MNKKVLVTGSKGQLGLEFQKLSTTYPNYSFHFIDKNELDISDMTSVEKYLKNISIDYIINAAAYTDVDGSEKSEDIANLVNNLGVENLATIAKEQKIKLVHISTDYVFDGTNYTPYTEMDTTKPINAYGRTKLAGEKALIRVNPENSIAIRTSWLYSSYGKNFLKTMLRLGKERNSLSVVFDQIGTPTYARDLALVVMEILPKLNNKNVEIFHYSNEGVGSWYDFAKEIFKNSSIECSLYPIESKDYHTPASRPYYSILNKRKIKERYFISIPNWRDSLKECLLELKEHL